MFVMVHPDLALAFLEALLNRPAQSRHTNHLPERNVHGSIAKCVFYLAVGERTAKKQPKVMTGKTVAAFNDTQAGDPGPDRPLCAFGHGHSFPSQGWIFRQVRYRNRRGLSFF